MHQQDQHEFRSSSFQNIKQWLHFNLKHDLQNCRGCRQRSRQTIGETQPHRTWFCSACHDEVRTPLSLHPVVRAILDGDPVPRPRCDRTGERIDISDAWISSDCRSIYKGQIAKHDQQTRQIETALRSISPCFARSESHFKVRPISAIAGTRTSWDDGYPLAAEAVQSTPNCSEQNPS
ncbi:MAG: hypothetical protein DSY92_03020 [Planctomycetota bacterium]|nr:MAG: hypothetical protein DSY92_03020 [Planctomycetota bacterium]